jgi:hypothetical protein
MTIIICYLIYDFGNILYYKNRLYIIAVLSNLKVGTRGGVF